MIVNAAGAVIRYVAAKLNGEETRATQEVIAARWEACKGCEFLWTYPKDERFHRCFHPKCGCWLDGEYKHKMFLLTEICDEERWPK
jgi:hypothetical protein